MFYIFAGRFFQSAWGLPWIIFSWWGWAGESCMVHDFQLFLLEFQRGNFGATDGEKWWCRVGRLSSD
jgi:hypothetical protein